LLLQTGPGLTRKVDNASNQTVNLRDGQGEFVRSHIQGRAAGQGRASRKTSRRQRSNQHIILPSAAWINLRPDAGHSGGLDKLILT
jgi:hypothetical protein